MRPRGQVVEVLAGLVLAAIVAGIGIVVAGVEFGLLGLLMLLGVLIVVFWTACLKWRR
jgi:heme A synthase